MQAHEIKNASSRDLLFFLKGAHQCTRKQLAVILDCSERQLTDYMLPEESKGHRTMSRITRARLERECWEKIEEARLIESGQWIARDLKESGFVSPRTGFRYPGFFLVKTSAIQGAFDSQTFTPEDATLIPGEYNACYVFDPHTCFITDMIPGAEKILTSTMQLDPEVFDGWISIVRLENRDQIEGFLMARDLQQTVLAYDDTGSHILRTRDGIFIATLHDKSESPAMNGLIVLSAAFNVEGSVFGVHTDREVIVIQQDGSVDLDGDTYLRRISGHPDYA